MSEALRCELFPGDLAAAAEFYVRVLGFEVARDDRKLQAPYVALKRGDVRLGLAQRLGMPEGDPRRRPPVGVELVLEVDDLDAARARVAEAGWPLLEDVVARPWGLRDFRLLDPAGYYWRVTTDPAHSAASSGRGRADGDSRAPLVRSSRRLTARHPEEDNT